MDIHSIQIVTNYKSDGKLFFIPLYCHGFTCIESWGSPSTIRGFLFNGCFLEISL